MLKKLFILLIVVSLSACAGRSKNYDSVNSAEEAEVMNNQMQENVDEVTVPDRVHFGFDMYNLDESAKMSLDVQSEWLKHEDSITVTIEGHCDARGTREYNLALGKRRANAVKDYLVSRGIDSNRINTISYGKEKIEFVGNSSDAHKKNRRAVTVVNK